MLIFFDNIFTAVIYGCLPLALSDTSHQLAVKRYTTDSLQAYATQATRSRIRCSEKCMADQRNNCTGFKFEEKECQLYNLPDDFNLTHASSAGADGVFVFRGTCIIANPTI